MRLSAIVRRYRQAGSIGSYLRMVRHVLCRRWAWMGAGRAVRMSVVGSPGPFAFRPGTTDFDAALEVFNEGEYADVVSFAGEVNVVIDLGANVGYSCMVWRAAWPGCTVVAVEPDSGNMALAKQNLEEMTRRAGSGRNVYLQAGVSGHAGRANLDRSGGAWAYRLDGSRRGGGGGDGGEVEVVTMERVLELLPPGCAVDLLKCDIEGAEAEVFGSGEAAGWLPRVRRLVVETHRPYTVEGLEADLRSAGAEFDRVSVSHHGNCAVGYYVRRDVAKDVSGGASGSAVAAFRGQE